MDVDTRNSQNFIALCLVLVALTANAQPHPGWVAGFVTAIAALFVGRIVIERVVR